MPTQSTPGLVTLEHFGHVTNMLLRPLLVYWLGKRSGRLMPSRTDIDPVDIPWVLSRIWLCDYFPESGRFRYRLAGQQINILWGYNIGGKWLDEIMPAEHLGPVVAILRDVVDGPAVVHNIGQTCLDGGFFVKNERIILPLSIDGQTVSSILGAIYRAGIRDRNLQRRLFPAVPTTVTVTPIDPNSSAQTVQRLSLVSARYA